MANVGGMDTWSADKSPYQRPCSAAVVEVFFRRLRPGLAWFGALAAGAWLTAPAAAARPRYDLAVQLAVDPVANLGTAHGTMHIEGWSSAPSQGDSRPRRCLYLPYNDDNYEFDPIRDFDLVPRKYARPERQRGQHTVKVRDAAWLTVQLSPHVVEILRGISKVGEAPDGAIELEFSATLPRWPDANADEWVYADFHPQPMATCPKNPQDSRTFELVPSADIQATFMFESNASKTGGGSPLPWQLATPAAARTEAGPTGIAPRPLPPMAAAGETLLFTGRKLVVALVRGFTRRLLPIHGATVEVFYRDPEFDKLIPTLENAARVQQELFGPLPFPRIVILETSDVEKSSLPGVIAINRPRQAGMSELQGDILNWTRWQVTGFVAEQWFGASLSTRSLDDLWLLRGFVDFATIESLANVPTLYSLLNPSHSDDGAGLNFDYRQAQDLLAAVLTYMHPYNTLTNANYDSLEPFTQQHSLGYIRHALALRQINWVLGRTHFRGLLKRFVAAHLGQSIQPRDFGRFFEKDLRARHAPELATQPLDPLDAQALTYLKQWWGSDEWPDFQLEGVSETAVNAGGGESYRVRIAINQSNGFSIPLTVRVTDRGGKVYTADAIPDPHGGGAAWHAETTTDAPYERVELEPTHQIFDWNRFDNNNGWADWNFLPGGATTFADDAYTVLWLPLATQLPGEPLTTMLVAQAFRYMHNSMTAIGTYTPKTSIWGYSVIYLTDFPKLGSYMVADAIQDKGLSFRKERVIEAGLYKTVSIVKDPYLEYGLRLRNREVMNRPRSDHQTLALKGLVQPLNQYGACNYSGKFEEEHTVHAVSDNYRYNRLFALAEGNCKVAKHLEFGMRGFGGDLTRYNNNSRFHGGNFRFHPQDINEARMRFDQLDLERADRIATFGSDVLIPAPLPIPDDFYVLKRETRYRMFFDYGHSEAPDKSYKDAGVGLWMPMGIDLVGKGSVSMLNFSALLVLYREAGDFRSSTPGLLFDFDFLGKI